MIWLSILLLVVSAAFVFLTTVSAVALMRKTDDTITIMMFAYSALALTCAFTAGAVWP
jgi:hypothetical protein